MEDLSAGPPHVTGHFDQLLFQGVCVLGQLVQAEGPVCPPRVQLGLHRLWDDKAKGSASRLGERMKAATQHKQLGAFLSFRKVLSPR